MSFDPTELPCFQEDFPNYHLKVVIPVQSKSTEEERFKAAHTYIQQLEKLLKTKVTQSNASGLIDQALELYDNQFNKVLANSTFKDHDFPQGDALESKYDTEYDTTAKLLYTETSNRHSFSKFFSTTFNIEVAEQSWSNYEMLFDTLLINKSNWDIPLPHSWLWDILDEYVYQFYMCSRWRKGLKKEEHTAVIARNTSFWNLEDVLAQLKGFTQKVDPQLPIEQFKTLHYLAYYAQLALVKVYVMVGRYEDALQVFQHISFARLVIYSRSGLAYQTLFTYAGFTYLMLNRYREATTLFHAIALFYNKYKQLYTKSFQFEQMNKNYEKIVSLLAISLVFYPEPLSDALAQIFREVKIKLKERQNSQQTGETVNEKFEKLNKYDLTTFSELFYFSSPKIVDAILDMNDYKTFKADQIVNDLINEQKDKLQEEFLRIQKINNVSQILKLYTELSVSKSAKLLKVSEDEIQNLLHSHKQRTQGQLAQTPFEQEVIRPFQTETSQLNFKIEGNVITVIQAQEVKQDLAQQISALNKRFEKTLDHIKQLESKQ